MARIAVLTSDVLAEGMAGPAIRAVHIAAELSRTHDVRLVSTTACSITDERFVCVSARGRALRNAVSGVDVLVVQGPVTLDAGWILRTDKVIVVDLYDPLHLEQLEQFRFHNAHERRDNLDLAVRVLNDQIARGDFFLCANDEQRQLWLGHLAALGRVNPGTYEGDTTLARLIAICPFGIDEALPEQTRHPIRDLTPGVERGDKVMLWAGGVYNWFDPPTLIRAVADLAAKHQDLKLFFLGMKHPNPGVPDMQVAWQSKQLSAELGLTGKHVFFNEGWVDYDDRHNYLLDADLGVSTHFVHVETRFAFRTRILDYLWAGLPVIATEGDSFAALITSEGLGEAVAESDPAALARAIERVLYDPEALDAARVNVARVRENFTWERTLAPLVAFCDAPRRAADAGSGQRRIVRNPVVPAVPLVYRTRRAWSILRARGPRHLLARVQGRLRARR